MQDIDHFRVSIQRLNKENVKEYLVETVQKADLIKIMQNTKYLMIKPQDSTPKTEKIPWKDIWKTSIREFQVIWEVFNAKPIHLSLIWTISLVLTFGFWDTFASSFLLDFLDQIKQ